MEIRMASRGFPEEEWVSLNETAQLAARLSSGMPENVARERVRRATWEGHVQLHVADVDKDNWHLADEHESPTSLQDIDVQDSTFLSKSLRLRYADEDDPFSLCIQQRYLRARIHCPSVLDRYFPDADYSSLAASRGGRPAKYDWAAFDREAGRWIYHNGIPKPQARLVRHIAQWCLSTWNEEPSESLIKSRVSMIIREYEQAG